jgi:hypothetical protein
MLQGCGERERTSSSFTGRLGFIDSCDDGFIFVPVMFSLMWVVGSSIMVRHIAGLNKSQVRVQPSRHHQMRAPDNVFFM